MSQHEEDFSEWKKNQFESKYHTGAFRISRSGVNEALIDIDKRLNDIEHKINPTAKKILSNRSQQMLLLHHLGLLEKLNEFDISGKKKAKLLSILLNASSDNIEGDLHTILNPKSKLNTIANYKVINTAFKQAGIKQLADKTGDILKELESQKNK